MIPFALLLVHELGNKGNGIKAKGTYLGYCWHILQSNYSVIWWHIFYVQP